MTLEPDTKDWTWVLEHPCPDCGFVATDVRVDQLGAATRATVAAYDSSAADYRDGTAQLADAVRALRHSFVAELPRGARVLEIGSGPGRDADALELAGLSVRRTDITPAFVTMMREVGHDADVLDPLTDDLADPQRPGSPYDGVWASACLLHVARPDLPTVLTKLAGATRRGGVLHISLKEGDGEQWSTHGDVSSPRLFVYWQEEPLRAALDQAAWSVSEVTYGDGKRGKRGERWLQVRAVRR